MSRKLLAALFAAVLVLAACGDDDDGDVTTEADPATDESADDAADDDTGGGIYSDPGGEDTSGSEDDATDDDTGGSALVTTASTDLGEILVDADGFTLYGFTSDSGGTPTCTEGCADTWPPVFVDSSELPAGLDPEVFSVVEHPSGSFQLKAGDWPLYRYAPDTAPGDTTGQGVGGVWYVVDPEGELIES